MIQTNNAIQDRTFPNMSQFLQDNHTKEQTKSLKNGPFPFVFVTDGLNRCIMLFEFLYALKKSDNFCFDRLFVMDGAWPIG